MIFINQDSGYLMIDIINKFVDEGYKCVLFAGRLVERDKKLHPGVRVEKIIRYRRATISGRLFTWITGTFQIWLKLVFRYRKDELFIVSNPPMAPLLPLIIRNRFRILIFDIYPDVLTEQGYLKPKSFIIRFWKRSNIKVFRKAEKVFTITEGMRRVLTQYAGEEDIKVVPLWTDNNFLKPVSRSKNKFIRENGLSEKYIVLYSGNIGLSGDVDILIDVAARTTRDDIQFVIIGEGAKKEFIESKVNQLGLGNVLLMPWQPVSELPNTFSAADLAVISLGAGASKLAIPSKLYNFLSVGAPLLCISPAGSEVENMVMRYGCGRNFEPSDIMGISGFILGIADNRELQEKMRMNSLKASEDFTSANISEFMVI